MQQDIKGEDWALTDIAGTLATSAQAARRQYTKKSLADRPRVLQKLTFEFCSDGVDLLLKHLEDHQKIDILQRYLKLLTRKAQDNDPGALQLSVCFQRINDLRTQQEHLKAEEERLRQKVNEK